MTTFQSLVQRDATREQLEEWCRGRAQAIPVAGTDLVLCRVLGKHLMYTLARDSALTPHLALSGLWEPWVSMAIARHLKPGMRCLDVGACYGYYSLLMADCVGEHGVVSAWEPYHFDLLQQNALINGFDSPRIIANPWAMGHSSAGDMLLMAPPPSNALRLFNAGAAEVLAGIKRLPHAYERLVEVHTLGGTDPYDFIKVDVEGYEAEVWRALQIETRPLTVCLEFTPGKHEDPERFLRQIEQDGFSLGTVGHDGVPRACSIEEALTPDTGDFRMLWLTR